MEFNFAIVSLLLLTMLVYFSAGARNQNGKVCQVNCQRTGTTQNVTCALDPEAVEGPYYLPLHLLRRNITEDRPGVPLKLHLIVMDSTTCQPVPKATVDIWHADAMGAYSGFVNGGSTPTTTFLRGIQETNAAGEVDFDTIYPGWYPGRCIHIHVEVFVAGNLKHTGQLFFAPSVTALVRTAQPYASRTDTPRSEDSDGIYRSSGGIDTTFDNVQGDPRSGLQAIMYIGINPAASATAGANNRRPGRNN